MKISEIIADLEDLKSRFGDIEVRRWKLYMDTRKPWWKFW